MTMARSIALACVLFGAIVSHAVAAPVVRVQQCFPGHCIFGTGCVIGRDKDNRGIVLTCAHGWTKKLPVKIHYDRTTGEECTGEVVCLDLKRDVGLIAFARKEPIDCFAISDVAPQKKDEVQIAGFGDQWMYRWTRTECKGYYGPEWMIVDRHARQGTSGGPVLFGGKIAGVVHGNFMDHPTDGCVASLESVRAVVKDCLGYIPASKGDVPPPADEPPTTEKPPAPKDPADDAPPAPKDPGPSGIDLSAIIARLDTISQRLDAIEKRKPAKGDPGPAGPEGPRGPAGKDGVGVAVDLKPIETRIEKLENARIPVRIYGENGKLISQKTYQLGEAIELRFVPVKTP